MFLEHHSSSDDACPGVDSGSEDEKHMVNEKHTTTPTLESVFTPDNLHSGSVILVRGSNIPNPYPLFCRTPFSSNVLRTLEVRVGCGYASVTYINIFVNCHVNF